MSNTTPRIVRILYLKADIDEKESAEKLEEAVRRKVKKPAMTFTCVTSSLMAIECVKSVTFDVIILEEKLSDFTGAELLNILFTSHYYISPIFLVKREEVALAQMRLSSMKYQVKVLPDPFSDFELCCAIRDALMSRKMVIHFHQPKRAFPLPPAAPVSENAIRERSFREELEDRAHHRVHPSAPHYATHFPITKRNRGDSFDAFLPPALNLSVLEAPPPPVDSATAVVSPTATQETTSTDEELSEFLNYINEEDEVALCFSTLTANYNNNHDHQQA